MTHRSGISILISTYNGENRLRETLTALSKLDIDDIPFVELIIVDNGSTDNTSTFTKKFWMELGNPYPITSLMEQKPGKLNAQEKGIGHAKGEFIVICDDDNSFFSDYLKVGYTIISKNPKVGVLGGQGIAKSSIPLPEWFKDYSYFFACAPQAPQTGNVNPTRNVVYGAGMWFRTEAYINAKNNDFEFILGSRTGNKLTTGGEDSELCWAIKMQGYEIWYIDEMKFFHHIPVNRLSEDYKKRLLKGMNSNGPYGKLYLRIWKGEISKKVKWFWLKECIYTIIYMIKLPFNNNVQEKRTDFKRALNDLIILLETRESFDLKINSILKFKMRVSG